MTVVRDLRHGTFIYNPQDQYIGRSLELYGEFSEQEVGALVSIMPEGGIAVDVGANIGCVTVPLARRAGHVYAIEPQRVTFQHLCANLALNAIRNVTAIHAGAGDYGTSVDLGEVDFDGAGNNGGFEMRRASGARTEKTRIITLDSLELDACHLLKIDVEGMEHTVLEGAITTIEKHTPYIYLEADREAETPAVIELLHRLGYQAWWHLPPLYNPENFAKNSENAFPGIVSINLICAHSKRAVNVGLPEALPGDTFTKMKERVFSKAG